jgi:hypothetical protein
VIEIAVPSCTGNAPVGVGRVPCPVCAREREAARFAEQHPQLTVTNSRWPLIVAAQTAAAEIEFRLIFSDVF